MKIINFAFITALIFQSIIASELSEEDFDLEALMNIEVTSVSKSEENSFTASSAIYVITEEEITRKEPLISLMP